MTKVTTLDNGFKIVTEKKKFNNVSMGVYVNVGMLNETDELNGISHFLEHMAFKGTKTKTALELSELVENLGGNCNAYTSETYTAYLVNLLPEHWKTGVDFLADIIKNSTFPEEEIEKERNVILQEISMYEDDVSSVTYHEVISNVYKGQALSRKVIGTAENVKKFTRDDFIKYINEGYVANKMVFSITGNINHEEVVEYVKAAFSDLNTEFKLPTFTSKYVHTKESHEVETKFQQAQVCMTTEGLTMFDKDRWVDSVFTTILSGGMSCRLFQEVREKYGLGYATSCLEFSYLETGVFGVWAAVENEDIEKTLCVLNNVLSSMTMNITEEELKKAKNMLLYSISTKEDDIYSLMHKNAIGTLFNRKLVSFKNIKNKIEKITLKDVYKYARKRHKKDFDITIIKPKPE